MVVNVMILVMVKIIVVVMMLMMMMIRRKGKGSHGSLCSAIRRQSPENVDINQVILHRYLIMKSYFVFSLTARSPGSS